MFAADTPAEILARYTELTGRAPPVPLWGLGLWVSRAYYETPEEASEVAAALRERKIPCDVLTLDGRAAWKVETRFDFEWDEERFPDPYEALARIKAHQLRVCVWEYPYVSIHSPLFEELAGRHLPAQAAGRRPLRLRMGHIACDEPLRQLADAAAGERDRRFHAPGGVRVVARCAREALRAGRRRDQDRLRRARARRRGRLQRRSWPAPAQRLSAALQPVRFRGDRTLPAAGQRAPDGLGPRRLDRQPAPSRSSGAETRRATGRALPHRSAAGCRGE